MIVSCETLTGFLLAWIHIPNCWTNAGRELLLHVTQTSGDYTIRFHENFARSSRGQKETPAQV